MDPSYSTSSHSIYKNFNPNWKLEPEYSQWLQEVKNESDKFFCLFCKRKYCGNRTEIKKHYQSKKHKQQELIHNGSVPEQIEISNTEYQKRFRLVWMEEPQFKNWLLPVKNDGNGFFCAYCENKYVGGKSEITKHSNSSKHKKIVGMVDTNEELRDQYKVYVEECKKELKKSDYFEEKQDPRNGFKFRFRDEFFLDPDLSDWLLKVDDPEKYGCKYCGSLEYSGGKWEMKKHSKSLKHRKNAGESSLKQEIPDPDEFFQSDTDLAEMFIESPLQEVTRGFQTEWLFIPELSDKNMDLLGICRNLLEDPEDYDVLIHTNEKTLKAHRLILASCSFFRTIFQSSLHFEMEKIIRVHLPDFSSNSVELLLKILYTGEVSIPGDLVEEFVALAKSLDINELAEKLDKPEEPVPGTSFQGDTKELSNNCQMVAESEPDDRDAEQVNPEVVNLNPENSKKNYEEAQFDSEPSSLIYLSDEDPNLNPDPIDYQIPPPKRQKIAELPKSVEKLRDEFSKFKDRLKNAINQYRTYGGELEDFSKKFRVPLEVLKRNLKGIEVK